MFDGEPNPGAGGGGSEAGPASLDALEQELTTLAAHMNAGNYRFLVLLEEFRRRGGHVGWGIASCAHWLQWKCGIGLVAAREKVRVAKALPGLPKLADAMRRGVISYCKVRAMTRIATPENEALLLAIAEDGTVSHVEKTVRLYRRVGRLEELDQANEQHAERGLRCYWDESGALVVEGRLPPEQGALVMKALQAASDALREAEHASPEAPAGGDGTSGQAEHASREAAAADGGASGQAALDRGAGRRIAPQGHARCYRRGFCGAQRQSRTIDTRILHAPAKGITS